MRRGETLSGNTRITPLAIGQQIKVWRDYLLEEFGAVAAPIKDHRQAPLAHQRPHLGQDAGQHFDQPGVGLGHHDEQRVPGTIVDPVIRSGRQRDAHASHVGLGQGMLAVINPHVTVGIEKAQSLASQGNSLLGQGLTKLRRTSHSRQAGQLAPQRFDFGRPIQTQHSSQVLRRVFLEALGPFDAPQRHEQKREQTGAQSIEGRPEAAVDFSGTLQDAAGDQHR